MRVVFVIISFGVNMSVLQHNKIVFQLIKMPWLLISLKIYKNMVVNGEPGGFVFLYAKYIFLSFFLVAKKIYFSQK